MSDQPIAFGDRLRQIRKGMELSQELFAKKLGTSKQVISRYETNKRAPKITLAREYAEKLDVPLAYILGESEELYPKTRKTRNKPSFEETVKEIKYNIEAVAQKTGLTERLIRVITDSHANNIPFIIAWHLAESLDIPIEIWTGDQHPHPPYITLEAREIALAYDQADIRCRNIVRLALHLRGDTNIYPRDLNP